MKPPVCPPPGEAAAVRAVVDALHQQMVHDYPPGRMRRDAHPKSHGTVQAEFTVDPSLPTDLRHGVFAHPGRTYRAWVRFSNCFQIKPDLKADTRGMAVKLVGVDGQTFMDSEKETQDFLAATGDAFFIPDALQYVGFPEAARKNAFAALMFFVKRRLWRGLAAMIRSSGTLAMNPLAIDYFSQTPYRLGDTDIVKFRMRPLLTDTLGQSLPWAPWFSLRSRKAYVLFLIGGLLRLEPLAEWLCARLLGHPDLLRRAMDGSLRQTDAWFEFLVQRRAEGMPIEDATASWSEAVAPFERVAWIRIPRQVFTPNAADSDERRAVAREIEAVGENLSFNPWHALAAHEPLGSINRARRHTNGASSETRHTSNNVPLGAPSTGHFDRIAKVARLAPGSVDPCPSADPATLRSRWSHLYLRRVPLLVGVLTALFPIAAVVPASPLSQYSRGIFDVRGPVVFLVSLLSFLLAFTIMAAWWVITAYSDRRCGATRRYAVYPIRPRWYGVASALVAPVIAATTIVSDRSAWTTLDWLITGAYWLGGFLAAATTAWAVRWLADFLGGMVAVQDLARRVRRSEAFGAGYVDAREAFLPGHLFVSGLAIVILATYVTIGAHTRGQTSPQFPGLVFLILLPTVLCWSLSGLTFFADRFKAPVLLPLVAFIAITSNLPGPRHVFEITPFSVREPVTPRDVLTARSQPAVIVVAASGGGAQAAAWTARVLTGLVEKCRAESCAAADAIRLVSAASGGSVGATAFLAAYQNGALPSRLQPVRDQTVASSQDALWRSLVFEDLYRPLRLLRLKPDPEDRGLALERMWGTVMHLDGAWLSTWREEARLGDRPGMILNATIEERRQSILLSTAGHVDGTTDFSAEYNGFDLPIARAARLSATFPVVVPFARDSLGLRPHRIVDGGYSDQFGLDAATAWLQAALTADQPAASVKRVLLLEIRAPMPAETALTPRWRDQFERDRRGVALLQERWKDRVGVSSVALTLCASHATQWHVTAHERREIESQWEREANGEAIASLVRFLKGEREFAESRTVVNLAPSCAQ